jgi:hypothetical protein
MTNKIQWRVAPPLHLAEAVRQMAMREGRSDTNMLTRLVSEAVAARRAAESRRPEIDRLIDIIRGHEVPQQ